jgi:hypothetical protein
MGIEVRRIVKQVDDVIVLEHVVPDAAELAAAGTREQTPDTPDLKKERQLDGLNAIVFLIAFNHENRLRAIEGKPALTAAQFRAALEALL